MITPNLTSYDNGFYIFGHTISFSTKFRLKIKLKIGNTFKYRKVLWSFLTPTQQYEYLCNRYIPDVINLCCDKCNFRFEFNKDGELHAHGLIFIEDKNPNRLSFWLQTYRREILQTHQLGGFNVISLKLFKHTNYIHSLKNIEHWKNVYMMKDELVMPFKAYNYRNKFL